jgi:aminoacrylate peracid reductase
MPTPIIPAGSPPPLAPYSPGVTADNVLYVSGMLALDAEGKTIGVGDAAAQTRVILQAIKSVVEAAGGSMRDIAFNMIFLKDLADYPAMNGIYREYFPADFPARYCIRADLVRSEFLVEIASIAHLPRAASAPSAGAAATSARRPAVKKKPAPAKKKPPAKAKRPAAKPKRPPAKAARKPVAARSRRPRQR